MIDVMLDVLLGAWFLHACSFIGLAFDLFFPELDRWRGGEHVRPLLWLLAITPLYWPVRFYQVVPGLFVENRRRRRDADRARLAQDKTTPRVHGGVYR